MVNRTDIAKAEMLTYFFVNPNPDKPEITNHKHQISNKFQTTSSKCQIRSTANRLLFVFLVIEICLLFVFCNLIF